MTIVFANPNKGEYNTPVHSSVKIRKSQMNAFAKTLAFVNGHRYIAEGAKAVRVIHRGRRHAVARITTAIQPRRAYAVV